MGKTVTGDGQRDRWEVGHILVVRLCMRYTEDEEKYFLGPWKTPT